MPSFEITPSLYTANTLELKKEVQHLIKAGIKHLHFDVMDGNFVANYGFGTKQFSDLKKSFPNLLIDVHLMANNIEILLEQFKEADYLTFHFHSQQQKGIEKLIKSIKKNGNKVGLALDLEDQVEDLFPYLTKIDLVTLMSIKPGFTGQSFNEET
jgi:ribulose-phosphate 3-epimerase